MSDSTNPMDRSRKRVRIADNPSEVVALVESLSDQERLESWYSSSEFAASKDSVKELCRSYRQSRRYSDCLTQAYKTACGLADQPEEVPEPKPPNPGETEAPDEGLTEWMDGPRGLEGYSSRLHAMRRHRHFQDTKHAVFLEQARQNLSQAKDDTLLAKQAEQASRRARSFAFLLGRADAWAVNTQIETNDGSGTLQVVKSGEAAISDDASNESPTTPKDDPREPEKPRGQGSK